MGWESFDVRFHLGGPSFKVKQGYPNLKVLIACLLLVVEFWDGKPTHRKSWPGKCSGVVRFDLGPLLQGQTRIVKRKSAYNSLIIGPRGLQCETNL